jgi:hypothetical protein
MGYRPLLISIDAKEEAPHLLHIADGIIIQDNDFK